MPNSVLRDLYIDTQEVHLRLKLKVHLSKLSGYTLDVYGGGLASVKECKKRLGKTLNLRGDSMLHLKILL